MIVPESRKLLKTVVIESGGCVGVAFGGRNGTESSVCCGDGV